MIFNHSRFQIWNRNQHPYSHSPDEFFYANAALPTGVNSMGATLDYILAVLYPQSQPAVATTGDLPAVGNTINDMRVVQDDGDGKAASYRWEQREGDAAAKWYKIYDVDWGTDSILQAWQLKTLDVYVFKYGYDDRDDNGDVVAGTLAGQVIYGGASANTNLTLFANSGDGVGAGTGYVQFGDNVRPTAHDSFNLGTNTERWSNIYAQDSVVVGTLTVGDGNITDVSGTVSFSNNEIYTATGIWVGTNLNITPTQIISGNGTVSFSDDNIVTTGYVQAAYIDADGSNLPSAFYGGTTVGSLTLDDGSITDSSGDISFGDENLSTTGTLGAGAITGTSFATGNLSITDSGSDVLIDSTNGHLSLDADTGSNIYALKHFIGTTGYFGGQLQVESTAQIVMGNVIVDTDGIRHTTTELSLNSGTGNVVSRTLFPVADSTYDLGEAARVWNDIYFDGSLKNATQEITNATLFSLRDINVGVAAGMALFWDGSKWAASAPDTEIDHRDIDQLTTGDSGHTQFVMLAGRSGGQDIIGGTAASQNLTLESTSDGTKGNVLFKDTILPFTNASYSGGWSGLDVGSPSNKIRHLYSAGEFFGLRMENLNSNPASSAQNIGRVWFNTTTKLIYVDDGTDAVPVGASTRYEEDLAFNGSESSKNVTVTTLNMDARKANWQLHDNTNNYEQVYGKITATSATAVTVSVNTPLPAGTYRLVGIQ